MKSVTQIKCEIDTILRMKENDDPKAYKRAKKQLKILNQCLFYLETNPDKEFIVKMVRDINKKKETIGEGYATWLNFWKPKNENSKPQPAFNSETGITKMNKQLVVLKFLLKD